MNCRLCLSSEAVVSIFDESKILSTRIWNCCQLQVTIDDTLPNKICKKCESKLESFERFKLNCIETDQILKQDINNLVKIEIEEEYSEYDNGIIDPDILNTSIKDDLCDNAENRNTLNSNNSYIDMYENLRKNSQIRSLKVLDHSKEKSNVNVPIKKYNCNECNKDFFCKIALIKHKCSGLKSLKNFMKRHINSSKNIVENNISSDNNNKEILPPNNDKLDTDKFKCLKCFKLFLSQNYLTMHEISHFQDDVEENVIESENNDYTNDIILENESENETVMIKKHYKCKQCEKILTSKRGLVKHSKNVHSTFICIGKDDKIRIVKPSEKEIINKESNKSLTCPKCNKTFKSRSYFKEHIIYGHTTKKTVPCKVCGSLFKNPGSLQKHMKSIHLGGTIIQCNTCGKLLKSTATYKQHLKIHSNKIYFICDYCNRGFKHKISLTQHIKAHMGLKPHKCKICSRSFLLMQTLRSHILQHTGENPFGCELCPRRFKQRCNLKSHLRHFHKKA